MPGRYLTDRRPTESRELPESIESSHAEFVVGFPCTRFGCRGNLRRDGGATRPAIACSVCEHVYYLVDGE